MERARRTAILDPEQSFRHRRRREAVRAYYAGGHHLHGGAVGSNDAGNDSTPA